MSGVMILLTLLFMPIVSVVATEVSHVETNGTIGFTGHYEPIGTPDPLPPDRASKPGIIEQAKPSGLLPQTNSTSHSWLTCLGISIISLLLLVWKQKKKQNIQLNQNESRNLTDESN